MKNNQIFNLNDNEVQIWKNFELGGIDYNFSHLNAKKITFTRPERSEQYTLFFTISHHVFTKGIEDDDEIELHWIYPHPTDKRQFDLIRYKLSLNLPQIIETLPEQFCYHGGYSRYCCCKIHQDDGTEIYYQVVYRVWKSKGKMRFHIESAYPLDEKPGKPKKVNFWSICYNLLHGKKLPKPAQ